MRGRADSVPGAEPGSGRAKSGVVCGSEGDGRLEGRWGYIICNLVRISHVTAIHCPLSPLPHVKWPDGLCVNSKSLSKPRWKSSLSVRAGRMPWGVLSKASSGSGGSPGDFLFC